MAKAEVIAILDYGPKGGVALELEWIGTDWDPGFLPIDRNQKTLYHIGEIIEVEVRKE